MSTQGCTLNDDPGDSGGVYSVTGALTVSSDSFFYNLRKDNIAITVRLTSGEERMGRLRRFDKFALVLEVDGREEMIYKHAIASIRPENLPTGS